MSTSFHRGCFTRQGGFDFTNRLDNYAYKMQYIAPPTFPSPPSTGTGGDAHYCVAPHTHRAPRKPPVPYFNARTPTHPASWFV